MTDRDDIIQDNMTSSTISSYGEFHTKPAQFHFGFGGGTSYYSWNTPSPEPTFSTVAF